MKRRIAALVFIVFLAIRALIAQEQYQPDTILQLHGVTIQSERVNHYAKGQVVIVLDSLTRRENIGGSMADIIQGFTSAYIRNYGPGTLATISVRGTSANHTGLYWNGIRLSPPNIGYVDLSLVQGNFFSEVSLLYGGSSPVYGSSAIAGGLHLDNRPVFDAERVDGQVELSAGSFKNMTANGQVNYSAKSIFSRTAFSFSGSENDFRYENLQGEKEKMPHAGFFKGGFIQDFAVHMPHDQYVMASTWFQYGEREIPPTLTEDSCHAGQLDRSWRSMIMWKDFNRKNSLEAKAAWFNEFTRYRDPDYAIYSVIHSQTITGSFESNWEITKMASLLAGAGYSYEYADLESYKSPAKQHNIAFYASWVQTLPGKSWKVSLSAREELQSGYHVPFLYSLGAEGRIWKMISGRLSFSRNFRAPTFNERFWQPGGNPGIGPESSYNCEAGINLKPDWEKIPSSFTLTGFSSWVDNWILWLPGSGGLWSVENAQSVWLRGVEAVVNQSFNFNKMTLDYSGNYTMSFSTNQKQLFEYDASYKKQLIYTPVHRFLIKSGLSWRGFRFGLAGNYTGVVYTTKDNSPAGELPSWFLLDFVLSKSFNVRNGFPVSIQLNLNNVLDKDYVVTPYRPMPGVNLSASVVIKLSKQK